VAALDGYEVEGRPMVVQISNPDNARKPREMRSSSFTRVDDNDRKVYVGNIDFSTSDGKQTPLTPLYHPPLNDLLSLSYFEQFSTYKDLLKTK
jgi:hypothetical protein